MEKTIQIDDLKKDTDIDTTEGEPQVFKTYKIRFFGLVMIALANIASSMNWLAVAPVPDAANSFFDDCGLSTINWFANVFMLTYIVAGPISSWVYDHWSIKTGVCIDKEKMDRFVVLLDLVKLDCYWYSFTNYWFLASLFLNIY
jgi:hypothetical protein